MRFVIFGAGAIGGVAGARLHQSGHDVVLIARGAHLQAIRRDGLTLLTPSERAVLPLEAVAEPGELTFTGGDVVLLATKSQDTQAALGALRAAAGTAVPVVCLQNGVENERVALRLFESVYGAVVMAPTAHLEPGVVEAYGDRLSGMIDWGRYPAGVDATAEAVAGALNASRFEARAVPDVMRLKYAKLLLNLQNAVEALCGPGDSSDELGEQVVAEGRAALAGAGIAYEDPEVSDIRGRWQRMGVAQIAGRPRGGGSTWQSLARGAGSIESDYLNGEIALLGRLHGIPTPVNDALAALAARTARERGAPGSVDPRQILALAS
jgi:2-dehydropantoate 2-reductase